MSIKSNIIKAVVRGFATKPTTNGQVKPFINNRNPRNLEKMRLCRKPKGYPMEEQLVEYWHKLCLTVSGNSITAELIHNTDKVVVSASTKEWAIRRHLYSGVDTQAYLVLAKVFAQRCMECGITSMESDVIYEDGSKAELFLKELLKEGLSLEEPEVFDIHKKWLTAREKRPWTVLE